MNDKPWKDRSKSKTPQIHEDRISRLRRPAPDVPKPNLNSRGEANVVPGFQISAVMRNWITNYLKERPRNHLPTGVAGHLTTGRDRFEFMGPIDVLHVRTGLHIRQISRICNGELDVVGESQAELLLHAIGEEYKMSNGEIQVVPNPNWSTEKWINYMQERGCV